MWLVRLALGRPFTVAAFCLVVLLLGVLSAGTMALDIFPAIDIPVVVVVWNYPGLSAEDMERRVTLVSERGISTSVSGIVAHRLADHRRDLGAARLLRARLGHRRRHRADHVGVDARPRAVMPPGMHAAGRRCSSTPRTSRSRSSPSPATATEQQIFDYGLNFLRIHLFTVPGLSTPAPYGGKQRQIMVDDRPGARAAKGLSPAGRRHRRPEPERHPARGHRPHRRAATTTSCSTAARPRWTTSTPFPSRSSTARRSPGRRRARAFDGYAMQTNVVRVDGKRATLPGHPEEVQRLHARGGRRGQGDAAVPRGRRAAGHGAQARLRPVRLRSRGRHRRAPRSAASRRSSSRSWSWSSSAAGAARSSSRSRSRMAILVGVIGL